MQNANDRLLRLESAIAHMQHDVDGINDSLLACFRQLKETTERLSRLEQQLEILADPSEDRDPAQEKPPHY